MNPSDVLCALSIACVLVNMWKGDRNAAGRLAWHLAVLFFVVGVMLSRSGL